MISRTTYFSGGWRLALVSPSRFVDGTVAGAGSVSVVRPGSGRRFGGEIYRTSGDDRVQHVRVEIRAVWPDNGLELRVHSHFSELARVTKRGEHACEFHQSADIDIAFCPIRETKVKRMTTYDVGVQDVVEHA